jgi:hypothetical protein
MIGIAAKLLQHVAQIVHNAFGKAPGQVFGLQF